MSLWRQLSRGLRALTRRGAAERDLDDEVQHFLEEAAAAHAARGLSPEQARRAARLDLGGETGVVDQVRGYGWENAVSGSLADVRYGLRRLRADPAFTLLAVLTLALGIGATTAIFSAVRPILLQPLPYPHAERVTTLWEITSDGSRLDGTFAVYRALLERSRSFDALAVVRTWQPTLVGAAEPERLDGQRVTAGWFRVLGAPPALGRAFDVAEDRPGAPRVVVLSDALWRRRFGADAAILGRQIRLDDEGYEVVGVMPRGFENALAPATTLWTPLRYDMSLPQAWGHHLRTLGRLRAGVDAAEATRELAKLVPALRRELPEAHVADGILVTSLQEDVTREVRPALLAVLGAVLLLLAIACVNVAHLLLARGARRRGELAVRAALGAGRARVIRQLLAESLLLAAAGGALGIVVARLGVRALVALAPSALPRLHAIAVDGAVLGFAVGITTLVGLAFGLAPALRAAARDLQPGLHQSSRRTAGGGRAGRGRLVVAEVAIAVVLLVGSGLLLRSLQRLLAVPPGFSSDHRLTLQVQAAGHRFADDAATRRFFDAALDAVRQVPGVDGVVWTSQLPLSGDADSYGVHFDGDPEGSGYGALRYAVSPGYFELMGIPLRRGRLLGESDVAGAPRAAVLSESFARRKLGAADPRGQRVRIGPLDGEPYTIVGVVGDVRQASLAAAPEDAIYVTAEQWWFADSALSLVARTGGDAATLAPAIRAAIWSVDKDQPILRVATLDDLVAASAAQRRFTMLLFGAFALVALVLAATGVYGVLAGSVAERRREIGVRAAMGASRRGIVTAVLRQGLRLTALGAALGLAAATAGSQALGALLFGVSRFDAVTYAGVVALLLAVSTLAAAAPAWRAARVDPAAVLRDD